MVKETVVHTTEDGAGVALVLNGDMTDVEQSVWVCGAGMPCWGSCSTARVRILVACSLLRLYRSCLPRVPVLPYRRRSEGSGHCRVTDVPAGAVVVALRQPLPRGSGVEAGIRHFVDGVVEHC